MTANALQTKPQLDFNALYLDTNVLVRSGWPSPHVELNNLLMLAKWWGVQVFLPEPVSVEAEQHWLRAVQKKISVLEGAVSQLERIAKPAAVKAKVEHVAIDRLLVDYRASVTAAMENYGIQLCPFTKFSASEMFSFAVRYILPFEFEQEGKGFQDAVILASVLHHLESNMGLTGILVTDDCVFSKTDHSDFGTGIPHVRLRILGLDSTFALLWEPYWDETVRKPYAVERVNAKAAAEAATPMLKEFIASQITESMVKTGTFDRVLKLLSVREVKVMYVQTPLPDPAHADRQVRIAVAVSVECTALVEKDYSFVYNLLKSKGEPPKPTEEEENLSWLGGVEVKAEVVDRQFQNLTPVSLLTLEQLGSDKWWK